MFPIPPPPYAVKLLKANYDLKKDQLTLIMDGHPDALATIKHLSPIWGREFGAQVVADRVVLGTTNDFELTIDKISSAFAMTRRDSHYDTPQSKAFRALHDNLRRITRTADVDEGVESLHLEYPLLSMKGVVKKELSHSTLYQPIVTVTPDRSKVPDTSIAEALLEYIAYSRMPMSKISLPSLMAQPGGKIDEKNVRLELSEIPINLDHIAHNKLNDSLQTLQNSYGIFSLTPIKQPSTRNSRP